MKYLGYVRVVASALKLMKCARCGIPFRDTEIAGVFERSEGGLSMFHERHSPPMQKELR